MIGLIARRLLQLPLIILAIYTITFALAWSLPGSAVINDEGRKPPEEVLKAMERQYNLDNAPRFFTQYLYNATGVRWAAVRMGVDPGPPPAAVFDFGPSLRHVDQTVNAIVASSLPVSVVLGLASILIALLIGMGAGVLGALRPNSWLDLSTLTLALVGISLPSFVIGTLLLIIFPVWLGIGTVASWGRPQDIILPALTLSLPFAAYIARLTRMGMLDVLGADYIRTARAKGVPERAVILRHALKNAFLPVLSYLGPACAYAMTGSFVVEKVFNVPGLGQHFVNGVKNKDLFLIMGVTLIYSFMLILFNLVVDVLYRWVDPRIEHD
ncbi:MAG: ABC transporter permease [Phycisphaerales bacterium]|nr:ABC transporter permease [Phycisphaerales bacterium]